MQKTSYSLTAGSINDLRISSIPLPSPSDQEVSVRVKAIGLNFADVFAIWGLYSATPKGEFIPGLEYAGVVEKVGAAVTRFKVGDRVMGVTRFGAYTTCLNAHQHYLIPLPTDWDFATGAAYLVQVLTAYYGLTHLGNLRPDSRVLIHSAAGGVGILANRIAKQYNCWTVGTVGSAHKVDFCKKEGYNEVIVRGDDFEQQLDRALGEHRLDVVMECIGGKVFTAAYERLAPEGRMVVYGSARYAQALDKPNRLKLIWQYLRRPKIDPQSMIEENRGILGFNLIYLYERVALMHELLSDIEKLDIEAPHVGQTFEWSELPDAIRLFSSGTTIGKVVVLIA